MKKRREFKHVRILPTGTGRRHHVVFPVSRRVGERLVGDSQKPEPASDSPSNQQPIEEGADVDSD